MSHQQHTHHRIHRREMLRLCAGGLLALGTWPGALRAAELGNSGEFTFVVVNDLHYLDDRCGTWFERFVRQINADEPKAAFCLIAGDISEHGKTTELGAAKEALDALDCPAYCVIGNHDYAGPADRKAYEDLFPGRLNYHFENGGWQIVALDSSEGQKSDKTRIQPDTLAWLDDALPKLDRKRPTIVFTHFPLGPSAPMRPINADAVLDRFREHNLQAVFNGHFHGFTERKVGETILTTNRCCAFSRQNHDGTKEKGYFVCRAAQGRITRTFVEVKPA